MYPIHENESGLFQELARTNDVEFGQLSYLVVRPGCSRGNHYHTRKREWFCCLHGRCTLELTHVQEGTTRSLVLDSTNREFVEVRPFENHIVTNSRDDGDCEVLIIISEEYHPDDPDTIRMPDQR